MTSPKGVFAEWAPLYREKGFWPRPAAFRTKRPPMKQWQISDPERPPAELADWLDRYGGLGLGLVTGSPFPDGTKLAAVDIDRDDYVRLAQALLHDPPSGRIGAKGAVFFCRLRGDGRYRAFKVKREGDEDFKVGDFLCDRRFCVLPPTTHPTTSQPYRWIGRSLLEVDYRELPIIEA